MYAGSCVYGAECGLLAACECGCCIEYHQCECDDTCDTIDDEQDDYYDDYELYDDTPEPGED